MNDSSGSPISYGPTAGLLSSSSSSKPSSGGHPRSTPIASHRARQQTEAPAGSTRVRSSSFGISPMGDSVRAKELSLAAHVRHGAGERRRAAATAQLGSGSSSAGMEIASQKFRQWDRTHGPAGMVDSDSGSPIPPPAPVHVRSRHRGLLIVAERDLTFDTSPPTSANSNTSYTSRPFPSASIPPNVLITSSPDPLSPVPHSQHLIDRDLAYVHRFGPDFDYAGQVTLNGYALFAVDQWVTSRSKLVKTVVSVASGEDNFKLSTYHLTPMETMSEEEAAAVLTDAIARLRQDGARPIDTPEGVLMVTSLPSLRQDLQTIFVPSGDYRQIGPGLHVNIDLKRLGCGGRSSLSLEIPSAAIENKFLSLYRFPPPNSRPTFAPSVFELVKLVQTALHICGAYGVPGQGDGQREEQDGLICERTGQAIRRWRAAFGKLVELETGVGGALGTGQYDEVAVAAIPSAYLTAYGPALFAALLSTVTSTRYKLLSLNVDKVPHDPFNKVRAFKHALLAYQRFQPTRSYAPTEYLTPTLLEQINHDYQREKQQDATRITRLIKNQVSQAGAGLASNLGALHIGGHHRYDDSGGSDGSDTDARVSRHRGSSADGRGSSLSGGGSSLPPDAITVSIQALVNTVLSSSRDKAAVISGRLRALYAGSITPHLANPRDWDAILTPAATRRRVDSADARELDMVEEEISPDRSHRLHHHRLRVPERKGAIKNMTSRTGNALRDVTGWARRGSLAPDTSDSESTPLSASGAPYKSRVPSSSRMLPSLSLPYESIEEESHRRTHTSVLPYRSRTMPISGDNERAGTSFSRRSATVNLNAPSDQDSFRPTLASRANTMSFAGSESYAGGVSDFASYGGGGVLNEADTGRRSTTEPASLSGDAPTPMGTRRRRPLCKMVSMDCLAEADQDGVEFLHDGHGKEAWGLQQRDKAARRGITRSRSFAHAAEYDLLDRISPDYLAVDVTFCDLISEMREREREMLQRVIDLKSLESALQDHFVAIVQEIKSRRAELERLTTLTEPLRLDVATAPSTAATPSIPMATSASVTMTPSAGAGNGFNFHPISSSSSSSFSQEPKPTRARRIQQQLDLKNDKLSYSMKELDRHVAGAVRLGEDVEVYVRSYLGGAGHGDGGGAIEDKVDDEEIGARVNAVEGGERVGWLASMWPRTVFKKE